MTSLGSYSSFSFNHFKVCMMTSIEGESYFESLFGLLNGVSAPYFFATDIITSSSLETITLLLELQGGYYRVTN